MWRPTTSLSLPTLVTAAVVTALALSAAGPTAAVTARGSEGSSPAPVTRSEATDRSERATASATQAARSERRRNRVGFSPGFSILYQEVEELRADLARMHDLGARRLRVDLSWALVERDRGTYDWSHSDRVFGEARAAGLKVLPILGYQPSWAGRSTVDVDGFSAFVKAAVERYGAQVPAWEIWNEPNLERFWFGEPDPAAYGAMVSTVSPLIRSLDPKARIVVGSMAPAVDARDGSQVAPETFLAAAGDHLAPGDFDAVSVHPYSYPAMPQEALTWNTFFRLPQMGRMAQEIGGPDVKLWLTEYGAPTGASDRAVSEKTQADMLVSAVRAARRDPRVGPIYLYSYRDAGSDLGDSEDNFGVVRHDGTPKRAALRLRALLNPS